MGYWKRLAKSFSFRRISRISASASSNRPRYISRIRGSHSTRSSGARSGSGCAGVAGGPAATCGASVPARGGAQASRSGTSRGGYGAAAGLSYVDPSMPSIADIGSKPKSFAIAMATSVVRASATVARADRSPKLVPSLTPHAGGGVANYIAVPGKAPAVIMSHRPTLTSIKSDTYNETRIWAFSPNY
jgi:hypothetical protein